ncbi:hypothetical protein WA026_006848 [Henosepilachna vigintioctopunctata]|uniref:Ubiquitin-like protease family profile domain-containing protein n=1 Tax=Henosepilachna vigintioctopunctata TaxID=420089 RepID=A0AAW1UI79_9CUCU
MKLLSFETFFCEKLMLGIISDGHKKWLALNEIWTQDIWLIPIHINSNHWTLLVVVFPHKIFLYLDSLKGQPPNQLIHNRLILCGFIENYRDARIRKFTRWQDWTLHVPIDIPDQNVSSGNCGIHVCAWVYIIITGTAFQFSDMHMNCFRKGMAHWLLNYDLIRKVNSRENLRTALLELPVNPGKIHRNICQNSHIPFEFSSTLEYCSSIKTLLP